ncbi:MAG: DUF6702 family protein [Flavobacteriales bacterium]
MQGRSWIVGFLLAAGLQASGSVVSDVHDFHYSRFGLQWNAETSTWQGILRVFTDDLEAALSHGTLESVAWKLGDAREHPQSDAAIEGYTTSNWSLIDSTGQALEWTYVGKEVDYDITFIYLESALSAADEARFASSTGFFELFGDQVNEYTLTTDGASLRLWLTSEDPTKPIRSPRHE